MKKVKSYLVVYVTDNNDLYYNYFDNRKDAWKFMEEEIPDYKAHIFYKGEHIEVRT